jgi:hypothetical protein
LLKKTPNLCAVLIPARPPTFECPCPAELAPPNNFTKLEATLFKVVVGIVPVSQARETLLLKGDQLGLPFIPP